MATSKHLVALISSHIEGDDNQFLSVALQAAAHEARLGHGKLARQLKSLVDQSREAPKSSTVRTGPVPIVQPKGELASLVSASFSDARFSQMRLDPILSDRLNRIVLEQRQKHKLTANGFSPRRKVLLVGPPGSGKTMTASALAGELSLPLFTIVFESLITRYMGETASKLRMVFDAMATTRGIYLFDEFDAIGGKRGADNDVGEARRVLNSFLQLLENDKSDAIIIAATNHPELLDQALFRRFDYVLHYAYPNDEGVKNILISRLWQFDQNGIDWDTLVDQAKGLSQAEVSRVADDAAKIAILSDRGSLVQSDLDIALAERRSAAGS